MKKEKFNSKFREYAQILSPRENERKFITKIYESFNNLLGSNNCIQIGSYPRFTAITPVNDLDILYILGVWDEQNHNPASELENLSRKIKSEYINTTAYRIEVKTQTHSVTIKYIDSSENEVFSVDIVPAYKYLKNEFGDDKYKVPEILLRNRGSQRIEYYESLSTRNQNMKWINSDPRGYTSIASETDNFSNGDFRKSVKIIKRWKTDLANIDNNLKLKSFHLEQVITNYFRNNKSLDIFDAIFKFFVELPNILNKPNTIADRADNSRYIDDYLKDLTYGQKDKIKQARDCLMKKLEDFSNDKSVTQLFEICFYDRKSNEEKYLFDYNIPVFTEDSYSFKINGEVQEREGGFRKFILDKIGLIKIDRKIKFRISGTEPSVDLFKWKVKNDDSSSQPRGEITDHQTKNDPESSKYKGNHYVECFAIKNNICVARARQNVVLEPVFSFS